MSWLCSASFTMLENFTAPQLCGLLWGLARLGHVPERIWAHRYLAASQRVMRVGGCEGQHVQNMHRWPLLQQLYLTISQVSPATLGHPSTKIIPPSGPLVDLPWSNTQSGSTGHPFVAVYLLSLALHPQDFDTPSLGRLVWSASTLQLSPDRPWLRAVCGALNARSRSLLGPTLVQVMTGLCNLG
jgi:hypothetical protein